MTELFLLPHVLSYGLKFRPGPTRNEGIKEGVSGRCLYLFVFTVDLVTSTGSLTVEGMRVEEWRATMRIKNAAQCLGRRGGERNNGFDGKK